MLCLQSALCLFRPLSWGSLVLVSLHPVAVQRCARCYPWCGGTSMSAVRPASMRLCARLSPQSRCASFRRCLSAKGEAVLPHGLLPAYRPSLQAVAPGSRFRVGSVRQGSIPRFRPGPASRARGRAPGPLSPWPSAFRCPPSCSCLLGWRCRQGGRSKHWAGDGSGTHHTGQRGCSIIFFTEACYTFSARCSIGARETVPPSNAYPPLCFITVIHHSVKPLRRAATRYRRISRL